MKIKEVANFESARYTENIPKWFIELDFVDGIIEANYSGEVNLIGANANKYYSLRYYYGSCSGCDTWEDKNLSDSEIEKELSDLIIEYTKEQYEQLAKRLQHD